MTDRTRATPPRQTKRSAVVVPIYNAHKWAFRCLKALIRAGAGTTFDVFVQDDHSPDPFVHSMLEALAAEGTPLHIGFNTSNRGFLGTCNALFDTLREKYEFIFLCNSDVLVPENVVSAAETLFDEKEKAALVSYLATQGGQLTLTPPDGVDFRDLAAYLGDLKHKEIVKTATSLGHLLGIRVRAIPQGKPLFDPSFGKGYGEESDLHFRLAESGWEGIVVPTTFVYHRGEASFGAGAPRDHVQIFFDRWRAKYNAAIAEQETCDSLAWLRTWDTSTIVSQHFEGAQRRALADLRWRSVPPSAPNATTMTSASTDTSEKRAALVFLTVRILHEQFDEVCHALLELADEFAEVIAIVEKEVLMTRRLPVRTFCMENAEIRGFEEFWSVIRGAYSLNFFSDLTAGEAWFRTLFAPMHARFQMEISQVTPLFSASVSKRLKLKERIAIVSPNYQVSGGIFVIKEFAVALRNAGYDVVIVTPSGIHHPPNAGFGIKVTSLEFLMIENERIFDLIVFTWWDSLFWVARVPTKRILWLAQSMEEFFVPEEQISIRLRTMAPYLMRGIDVIAVSSWIQAQMSARYGIEARLVLNQLSPEIKWKSYGRARRWKEIRSPSEARAVVEGSFSPYKNLDEAIQIVDELGFKSKTLVVAGESEDYDKWNRMKASGWTILNNISRGEVLETFSKADVLIRTSLLDSFGFAPLEMMATGGLAMVKYYQGAPDLCRHGTNSICFQSIAEIAGAFEENARTNGAYFAQLAEEGQRFALSRVGAAEMGYQAAVAACLAKPADTRQIAALQLLCGWRNVGLQHDPGMEREVAARYGFTVADSPFLEERKQLIPRVPVRYKVADFVAFRIAKWIIPRQLYTGLKAILGRT